MSLLSTTTWEKNEYKGKKTAGTDPAVRIKPQEIRG